MQNVIKNLAIVDAGYQLIDDAEQLVEALASKQTILVSLPIWQAHSEQLNTVQELGIVLTSDEMVEDIAHELARFSVVALNFPTFNDGRHFSNARLLRERYNYQGEILALGDVGLDLMPYMQRCGVNAFVVREDVSIDLALAKLKEQHVNYQAAVDQELPLYRRRAVA